MQALAADLADIEGQAHQGKLANVINSANEKRTLAKQLGTTKAAVSILQLLCKTDTVLRGFEAAVDRGQYVMICCSRTQLLRGAMDGVVEPYHGAKLVPFLDC